MYTFELNINVEEIFLSFRGSRYDTMPDRAYDFVFVRDPNVFLRMMEARHLTMTSSIIYCAGHKSPSATLLINDCRLFVLQQLLGADTVAYSAAARMNYVKPCTKDDLGNIENLISLHNFVKSLRVFGRSKLSITENH